MTVLKAIWCFLIGILGFSCTNEKIAEPLPFIPQDAVHLMSEDELYIFDHINSIRLEHGMLALRSDVQHYNIAAQRNLRNFELDTISHAGFAEDLAPLMTGGLVVGENLAYGYTTADAAINAWMGSESHRNNLLNPNWEFTGIKVDMEPETGHMYYTQVFSRYQ